MKLEEAKQHPAFIKWEEQCGEGMTYSYAKDIILQIIVNNCNTEGILKTEQALENMEEIESDILQGMDAFEEIIGGP